MKILMCQFGTETNTFAPGLMEFEQEAPYGWLRGEEVLEKLGGTRTYFGGALDAIVTADTPGLRSDPRLFDYKHVLRPIYPLDEDAVYDGRRP